MNMSVSVEVPHGQRRSAKKAMNVYVLNSPLELERRVLADASRQIEAIAFAVAGYVPTERTAELIEIAAKLQKLCLNQEVWCKVKR